MLNRRIKTFKCLRKNLQFIVQDHQDRSYMHANSTKKQQGLPSSSPLPTFPWHHTASNHSVCFSGSSYHKTGTESNVPKLNRFFNFVGNASLSSILIKFSALPFIWERSHWEIVTTWLSLRITRLSHRCNVKDNLVNTLNFSPQGQFCIWFAEMIYLFRPEQFRTPHLGTI